MRPIRIIIALATVFLAQIAVAQGQGIGPPPPPGDVNVINTPDVNVINAPDVNIANVPEVVIANPAPVPVTGSIVVSGVTTVSGTVNSAQSGTWTVGIDPDNNAVSLGAGETFFYDSGFGGFDNEIDLGPFDLSGISALRIIARGVNGRVTYELLANLDPSAPRPTIAMDSITVGSEDNNGYESRVYEVPPSSLSLHVTEEGPGGTNFHVVLIGR